MAGCYHDTQDFKSDLKIEVAKECDILEAGQDLDEIKCKKNPGHRGFIPFRNLTLEHLPNEIRNKIMFDEIKRLGRTVIRLVVEKIIIGKWIKEAGSGYVYKFNNEYFISTNNHVVGTDDDVKHCTVEFHYDDDSRSRVLTSRGVELYYTCPYRDFTLFKFDPVPEFLHQNEFVCDKLQTIVIMYEDNQIETIVTIPGPDIPQEKFVSRTDLNTSLIHLMFISWSDGSIGYLKSYYFEFKPIPSNIQQSTSIEIHINEDDGNRRVMPGDVVKSGDVFVVKISESIFQDEVKKCRLMLNGEVIGRGTRLYFEKLKSREFFNYISGIDKENWSEMCPYGVWLFDYHPKHNYIKSRQRCF